MLAELVYPILISALVICASFPLYNIIRIPFNYIQAKRRVKGIKFIDGFSPLDGHLRSFLLKPFFIYDIRNLVKKYGETFGFMWVTVPCFMTHDLDLIKRAIVGEKQNDRRRGAVPVKEFEVDSIYTANGDQWRRLRKAIAPALKSNKFKSPNVVAELEGSIGKLVQAIEARLEASPTNGQVSINVDDLAHRYTLDLAFSCFFKQNKVIDFHAKEDFMTETVNKGLLAVYGNPFIRLTVTWPKLAPIVDWFMLRFHPQGAWRKLMSRFIMQQTRLNLDARKQIERLKAAGKQVDEDNILLEDGSKFSRNMIDHVIDQFHEGKISRREYFHSTWFLLGAADKTSADAITNAIYQLAANEEIQDKLRKSIQANGCDSEYLAWVLNESLRLTPSVPMSCSRLLNKDLELDQGGLIPAGTGLVVPAHTIHRLEKYWGPDAEKFRPERFQDADKFHPFQFIPFGAGPRMCPGKEFALHEMKILLCTLLTRYKFSCKAERQSRHQAPFLLFLLADKKTFVEVSRL